LALATTLLFIFLPGGRSVLYRFEIHGEAYQLQGIPHLLEDEAKRVGLSIQCISESVPTRIRCLERRLRYSDQVKLDQLFTKTIPETIGWVSSEELKQKLISKQVSLKSKKDELQITEEHYIELDRSTEKLFKEVSEKRKKLAQLKVDSENRDQQTQMMEEAAKKTSGNQGMFEKKAEQLKKENALLKSQIAVLEKSISAQSKPLEERDSFQLKRDQLKDEIASTQSKIENLESALQTPQVKYADPEGYQLALLDPEKNARAPFPYLTFLWAPWIGLLLYVLVRKNPVDPFSQDGFHSVEDVIASTGLKLLKKV
jgi:hypothetical protein